MRFGLDISQHQLTWDEIVKRTKAAEQAGFHSAWAFDHFKALYGDPSGPCFEGWTVLAGLAAITEKIRLATLVTGVTYRHPSILLSEAVTIDHISNGRVDLAVGAAWYEQEHRELGIPFPQTKQRVEMLEDTINIARALMTEDNVTYEGKHFSLDAATYHPRPVQKPHIPIWVGASGERLMLPLVGRLADGWHSFGRPDDMNRKWAIVQKAAEDAGRDPATIERSASLSIDKDMSVVRERAEKWAEDGYEHIIVGWPTAGWPKFEEFCDKVLPDLAD
jgi:F420-dependent oxidoreductase-like protein